ncbi:Vacuolar amino acid transporter 3 [Erysiphe necator]|uniref:Putative amino acid n=1 Tax=Uncinula necator TaxID=52586 RepID=A0A0B1P1E6_UNCNE|nr:Vacuolar amino acid transporter 3 [Erysiphe necator]KHJ30731.1 putative amino acid [Erysiphe necator]
MNPGDDDILTSLHMQISSSPSSPKSRILSGSPISRHASTARLASPAPFKVLAGTSQIRQSPQLFSGSDVLDDLTPLANITPHSSLPGPGTSALAAAIASTSGQFQTHLGTPPFCPISQAQIETQQIASIASSNYGSFDRTRLIQGAAGWTGSNTFEDPEIVKRHLVQPSEVLQNDSSADIFSKQNTNLSDSSQTLETHEINYNSANRIDDDEFSSLQLQGGDVTRPIYKWTEEAEARAQGLGRQGRSRSFHLSRPQPENEVLDIGSIKVPGGFRRNFIRRTAASPSIGTRGEAGLGDSREQGQFLTNSFIEFLTIFGHFAGEELDEEDEIQTSSKKFISQRYFIRDSENGEEDEEPTETNTLLTSSHRKRKERKSPGTNSSVGATLLLLKSFVGTGVLFLPRAYLNGGMLFSNIVLLFVAALSYYCFVLLIRTRLKVERSFGDIGGILYGSWFRYTILASIVAGQIGFVAAYIVFISQNLQAFILAVTSGKTYIDNIWLILMQTAVFLPFSLLRDISKLGFTALIADAFILFGILVLYYFDIDTLIHQNGPSDIVNFNPKDWTLFIGTAVFTFEGIGLIIPIQESMRNPKKFPAVLGVVMIIIIILFLSVGVFSYAAYGSKTETIIILNLPQDSKLVNGVQLLYSIAILLSTPLQLFPAIRITENEIFTRSGRYNQYIKWKKNVFRFFMVMFCAGLAWVGAANLDKFIAIVGSVACVPLVYIYPPMLHLKGAAKTPLDIFIDIFLCIFGSLVMVYTTFLTIIN